jgi:nicotinamidase-related amidase
MSGVVTPTAGSGVTSSPLLLDRARSTLLVVDVQEAFAKAVPGFDALVGRVGILAQAARILGVPVIVTEQYPRGLGDTVAALAEHLDGVPRLSKTVFSAARADGFALDPRRDQVLVCGIEAHVCVNQTVCDLLAGGPGQASGGRQVHVVADAVASRTPENRAVALAKMERAGALPTSTEAAVFEWLGRAPEGGSGAGRDEFKAIQALVR